jgi:hypothetical protein
MIPWENNGLDLDPPEVFEYQIMSHSHINRTDNNNCGIFFHTL